MLPYFKRILFFCALAALAQTSFAQRDSAAKIIDSVNNVLLKNFSQKITEIQQQSIEDSIEKANLESQLNALKTTDNLQKEELQKRLQDLAEKDARRLAEKKHKIDSLRLTAKSFPVDGFFNDTLFSIYSRQGGFTAQERADVVSKRLKKLADNFSFNPDSLKMSESETSVDLTFGETIVISVSDNDALWNDTTKTALAAKYKKIIGEAVMRYKAETSVTTRAKEIGLALLVLAIMGVLIYYLGKLFKWTSKKITLQEGKLFKGVKIKGYTLLDAKRELGILLSANSFLKWLIILLVAYMALPVLFGIFPRTKTFADILFGYILTPVKRIIVELWDYLPKLITIIVIIIFFRYVLKGIHFLKTEIEKGNLKVTGFYADWANPTFQIVRVVIFAFMLVVIFPFLPGSDSPVFKGVSVFLGFLFTFGSAGSLSNIMSGLVLTYMRLFKIGDRVKIGDVLGDVIEKSMLVTRIRTIKNEIISIPNSTVMSSHTINYSSETTDKGLILYTSVTIGYDVPWRDMHKALLNAADRTDLLLKEPKPFVLQTSLDDFYVSYQINAYTLDANEQFNIYSQLHCNIQDCCYEAGIEILSPHYTSARDGNATAMPPDYLAKDYKAPAFNVTIKTENK
jgi:small-conductance mechanosensitive channel